MTPVGRVDAGVAGSNEACRRGVVGNSTDMAKVQSYRDRALLIS